MKRWLILFSFVLLFLGLVSFRGYQQSRVGKGSVEIEKLPVRIITVRPETFAETLHVVGTLEPEEQAAVVPKLKGCTVLDVSAQEGDRVSAGQILAVLDDSLVRSSLGQAGAAEASAGAALKQAESQLATTTKDFTRMEKLLEEEVISPQEFDHARGQYEVALAMKDGAYRRLLQAREARRALEISLGYHHIEAPVDGIVVKRLVDPGDVSDTSAPAFVINSQVRVKVTGAVPEKAFTRIRPGQSVRVKVDALDGREFDGTVSRISPVIDPDTRTGEVEIILGAEDVLKPGMFARVSLSLGERDAPSLPREAVFRLEGTGEWICYVVSGDRAFLRVIERGLDDGNRVEVTGGLSPEERVVVTRSRFLKDGIAVEVEDN